MELLVSIFLRHLIMYVIFHMARSVSTPLHHVFHYYEPLYYDHLDLKSQHTRVRRSSDGSVHLKLSAFQRTFNLELNHDSSIFKEDVHIEGSKGAINVDTRKLYKGFLQGESSHVDGIITSTGHFQGQIHVGNETYFIEPAHVYFPVAVEFQSIIYRSTDVNFDFESSFCKSDDLHRKLISDLKEDEEKMDDDSDLRFQHHTEEKWNEHYVPPSDQNNKRQKRALDPLKTVCELYLQADHLFYQRFGSNHETVIEQLGSYVQAINSIFGPIDFDGDTSSDNIQFVVKRIKIYDDPSASGYPYSGPISVDSLLSMHSKANYDSFCLSYLFTDRDFSDGVLGLAWVASLTGPGGVCEKYKKQGGTEQSLNSGLVTVKNYGKPVATAVTQVTFSHEIGHNFGSNHDTDGSTCAPGGNAGNYIMYARATSGYLSNNRKFSDCSINSIGPILEKKARDSNGCFIAPPTSICGNRIVEGSEECDCGWDDECDDICCHPATSTGDTSKSCKYNNTQGASNFCSPSNGLCCSPACSVWLASDNFVCRQNTSCRDKTTCAGGTDYTCPAASSLPNGTVCAEGQVCFLGECTGSICLANNLKSCQCAGTGWGDPKLCNLCCEDNNGTCREAKDIVPSITETKAVEGSLCNNFQGYCDVFYICQKVDPSGPLDNLRKYLFSGEIFNTLKTFLTEKWYVTLCGGLGIILLMGIFIKCCSKSHGPKKGKEHGKHGSRVSPDVLHM